MPCFCRERQARKLPDEQPREPSHERPPPTGRRIATEPRGPQGRGSVCLRRQGHPRSTATCPAPASEAGEGKGKAANAAGRVPLTTRIRTDFGNALKRASLQRQLEGQEPNTVQDILEEALEPWLRKHGYLT